MDPAAQRATLIRIVNDYASDKVDLLEAMSRVNLKATVGESRLQDMWVKCLQKLLEKEDGDNDAPIEVIYKHASCVAGGTD
jgi:hypothetical protein